MLKGREILSLLGEPLCPSSLAISDSVISDSVISDSVTLLNPSQALSIIHTEPDHKESIWEGKLESSVKDIL